VTRETLEVALLLSMGAGLTLYVLLGGADFGGGVWDLLAAGPTRDRQRALISAAIGPVWEANHVWLIFVITALFAAFPLAFAVISQALYLPISIAVAGVVLRGAAFAFRSHGDPDSRWQRAWTRVFGIASLVAPFALGMAGAALSTGDVRVVEGRAEASLVGAWTGPLSWLAGGLALAMCAHLAAAYLTVEAGGRGDRLLEHAFRRRAVISGVAAGALALFGLPVMRADAPQLWAGMISRGWPLVVLSGLAGLATIGAIVRRRDRAARIGAAVAVAAVIAGWGVAQWPHLILPDLTAAEAAAPLGALRPIAIGYVVGGALVAPSLYALFRVFKRPGAGDRGISGSGQRSP
jgi:cytochrome d ubiquinol oxidase subunit II